ncbi:MAG: hypothetical protein J6O90_05880 [Candidatus Methanomethylophilaceae archaeon]|nr:hypothetical protein [Candidatus Methanomethylophilaceae archaeon]
MRTGTTVPSKLSQRSRTWSRLPKTSLCPVTSIPILGLSPESSHQSTMAERF